MQVLNLYTADYFALHSCFYLNVIQAFLLGVPQTGLEEKQPTSSDISTKFNVTYHIMYYYVMLNGDVNIF